MITFRWTTSEEGGYLMTDNNAPSEFDNDEIPTNILNRQSLSVAVILALLFIVVVVVILQMYSDEIGNVTITGIDIAIGAILSIALVLIYGKQTEVMGLQASIQNQQTSIMQDQRNLMRIDHKPEIEVGDVSFDGDEIEVGIENVGHGVAKKIEVEVRADYDDSKTVEVKECGQRLKAEDGRTTVGASTHEKSYSGRCMLSLKTAEDSWSKYSCRNIMDQLVMHDISEVSIDIKLKVWDQLGNHEYKDIFDYEVEVDLESDKEPRTASEIDEFGQPVKS